MAACVSADVLLALVSPLAIVFVFVIAAASCVLASSVLVPFGTPLLLDYTYFDATLTGGFAAAMALLFALLGIIVGLWAERWDHYGAVEGFVDRKSTRLNSSH